MLIIAQTIQPAFCHMFSSLDERLQEQCVPSFFCSRILLEIFSAFTETLSILAGLIIWSSVKTCMKRPLVFVRIGTCSAQRSKNSSGEVCVRRLVRCVRRLVSKLGVGESKPFQTFSHSRSTSLNANNFNTSRSAMLSKGHDVFHGSSIPLRDFTASNSTVLVNGRNESRSLWNNYDVFNRCIAELLALCDKRKSGIFSVTDVFAVMGDSQDVQLAISKLVR